MRRNIFLQSPLSSSENLRKVLYHIRGKRVIIVGLGLFGGGAGAARFFCELGAEVTVTDLKSREELAPAVAKLSGLPIRFCFGSHNDCDLAESDLIVLNPAVPRGSHIAESAAGESVPMTSPMNVFLALCPARVIAVTGSVGKSTTTAMLAGMLIKSGRNVYMGGNIGISLLGALKDITSTDTVLLELSSVQLEDASALPFSPHVAIVTNILPNHLDRHGSFAAYAAAKENIIKFQGPGDMAILNAEDPLLAQRWKARLKGSHMLFSGSDSNNLNDVDGAYLNGKEVIWRYDDREETLFSISDLNLPGRHNIQNATAAAAAARWLGAEAENIQGALQEFKPLEHRLEECGCMDGISFYNDSDSTTPDSTIAAIDTFPMPITLICGGKDKGFTFTKLAEAVAKKVDVLVTLGQCGPLIAQLTRECGARAGTNPIILEAQSLPDAVQKGYQYSMPGSTVLFSPACSSFDMFQNFAERGREFKRNVQNILRRNSPGKAIA